MITFGTGRAVGLLWLAAQTPLAAQKIEYSYLPRQVLEERLQQAPFRNSEREHALQSLFEAAGCHENALTIQPMKHSRTPNLICTLDGSDDATIIVGAHYDKVPAGQGIVDDWSGASMLPSLYQVLREKPRRFRFRFVAFAREEEGLIGSRFYVRSLDKDEKSRIIAMVNIECIGLTPTKVWVHRADKRLVHVAGLLAAALHYEVTGVNVELVGDSDSHPFVEAKIPVIDFHSVTPETLPILHSNRDTMSAIRMDDYENSYRFLSAYLTYLDTALAPDSAAGSSR